MSVPKSVCVFEVAEAVSARIQRQAQKPAHWANAAGTTFKNPWPSWRTHDWQDYLYFFSQHQLRCPSAPHNISSLIPVHNPQWDREAGRVGTKVIWLGHSSVFVEYPLPTPNASRGFRVLFDPIFSERCSPVQWVGPKRITPAPCQVNEIPDVDAIVISHNHYDHLDATTIRSFFTSERRYIPHVFAPLGTDLDLRSMGVPASHCHVLDWWDSRRMEVVLEVSATNEEGPASCMLAVDITCTPNQHHSGRSISNSFFNFKALWASWVIKDIPSVPSTKLTNGTSVFFAGDTGYKAVLDGQNADDLPACPAFNQIGEYFGGIDIALIPIGAYLPRRSMSPVHCNPEDSVNVFKDVRAKHALGIHWGTFILTTEPVMDPPSELRKQCEEAGVDKDAFICSEIGQTLYY